MHGFVQGARAAPKAPLAPRAGLAPAGVMVGNPLTDAVVVCTPMGLPMREPMWEDDDPGLWDTGVDDQMVFPDDHLDQVAFFGL